MEIEQQPSPWPCVVMLIGLLICCVAAPCYWQREQSPSATGDAADSLDSLHKQREIAAFSFRAVYAPFEKGRTTFKYSQFDAGPNSEVLRLWAPPSIDELVAARVGVGQYDPYAPTRDQRTIPWMPYANSMSVVKPLQGQTPTPAAPALPPEFVTEWFAGFGSTVSEYFPASLLPDFTARLTQVASEKVAQIVRFPQICEQSKAMRSTVRLLGPEDRLAMLPAAPQETLPEPPQEVLAATPQETWPAAPQEALSELPQEAPPKVTPWCVPQTLYDQLQRLSADPHTAFWASQVTNELHSLTEREQPAGDDVQAILSDLTDAAAVALQLAESTNDDRLRVELLRTHWALVRRLDCWTAIYEEHLAFRVRNRVAARGDLGPYFNGADPVSTPADVIALSRNLEDYESTRSSYLAAHVVEQQRMLAASPASFDRAMADAVEQHYRNANVRIAISAEMINRLVGPERAETRPVHDRIAGAYVRGNSEITSRSRVEIAPAENEWQLRVQTNGVVESNTLANAGAVRLRSRGATDFYGSKSVVVRPNGVHLQPSDVEANSRNRLMGVTTDYDWLPIIGSYARNRALQEYRARRNRVRTETELRVASEASETLDRETHEAMEQARQRLYSRFTERFDQYGIKLTTIEMKSTSERLVARVRVAGDDQLGSNTPRPRALSDSLASVQIHETAMSNLAVTFGLDGQRLTGAELKQKIQAQFPKLQLQETHDTNRHTVFQFAAKNAVQIHMQDGRLELVIALDSVELDGDAIPDVIVHAYYKSAVDGLHAQLERDGALGIEGRISSGERARLHNIFQTVLPPERALQIARLDDTEDGRDKVFEGLMITQFVMEDGWLGIAIGPQSAERVAERFRSLR